MTKFATFCILCLFSVFELLSAKKLIVVLIDGVRWDYIQDPNLKGIRRIMDNGVRAEYVVPIFPSLSYPNWYTIVTGLYAENHGFVHNAMYDNETDSFFLMIPQPGADAPHWWNQAEPIWVTAEKNNKRSGLYWWGGCEVEIRGTHPTICERQLYDGPPVEEIREDFLERIDDIVEMFKPSKRFPVDRLSLALMYYVSVDFAGHHSGANSLDAKKALYDIDGILDKMQKQIKKAGLDNEVNIMLVSDHGMTNVRENVIKYIDIEKFASRIRFQLGFGGESQVYPLQGMLDKLVSEMAADKIDGLLVYKKEDIPERYHIKNNKRTPPILLVAKKGYYIKQLSDSQKRGEKGIARFVGHHGYDPEQVQDMRTIFLASGPDFRKGIVTNPLQMTDIYNVMCSVLQIPPLPNNGSWDRVQPLLRDTPNQLFPKIRTIQNSGSSIYIASIYFVAFLSLIFCLISRRIL